MAGSNRDEQVVALKYDKGYKAPRVVAKGRGYLAEQILNMAEQHDIMVHTDKMLAENLNRLHLGEDIPQEMFEIVARIYAFVDKIDVLVGEIQESMAQEEQEGREERGI